MSETSTEPESHRKGKQMNRQQFQNHFFQQVDPKPDKERQKRTSFRAFWFVYVPLGALAGFAACVVGQDGALFFPVWGLTVLFIWAFNK